MSPLNREKLIANNSFLHPVEELHFGTYRQQDLKAALIATEKLAQARLDKILQLTKSQRDFDNTVLALTRCAKEFEAAAGIAWHLESTLGESWSQASLLASKRHSELVNRIMFHKGIYKALRELAANRSYVDGLSAPRRKLLKDQLRDFERNGVALPEAKRRELKSIREQLSKTTNQFAQNVVKSQGQTGILLASADELEGLETGFIKACKAAADKQGKSGYWVAFSEPNYLKLMVNCSVRKTRQAMYKAAITIARDQNGDLAAEILKLRARQAEILGFNNYAEFVLEERMAKDTSKVNRFIRDLDTHYRPRAKQEFNALQNFARELEGDDDLRLDASDGPIGFYASQMLKHLNQVDEQELKRYLSLPAVLETMFSTFTTLYGVRFKPVEAAKWHPDVEVYEVHGEKGGHIATVWCDWYARPKKRSGAWMNAQYVDKRGDGKAKRPHLGYVCANLDAPDQDSPSLLSMRDIETVWHEFGHFMHLALSDVELPEQSMMSCKWDFIEAPSQIMENWVWQPEILERMARHYKTQKPLPDAMRQKLIKSRSYLAASKTLRQLSLADTDWQLHTAYDHNGEERVADHARRTKARYLFTEPYPDDAQVLSFTHIFASGYAAGYYSYKWAEAIEADLFSRFQDEGVLNPETGRKYRDLVLARGDEVEPDVLVKDFLDRETDIRAMLERDGILS